jgi:cobalt-zinc-cadmium efflux system outer membrane protein
MQLNVPALAMLSLVLACTAAVAQQSSAIDSAAEAPPTALTQLIAEASHRNPQIAAADHVWKAASQRERQVSTLPDPTLTLQQFSVGSPRPFAGYTSSDFAYIGVGASQQLPFPGKLRLRGEAARRAAQVKNSEINLTSATVVDAVKADYIQLAYLRQTLTILAQNRTLLDQLIEDATIRYQAGQGMQQDILGAQVDRTDLVRQVTARQQDIGVLEAHLKSLLDRDQDTPDIVPEPLAETPLLLSSTDLLARLREHNPQLSVDHTMVSSEQANVASAQRERKPDFDLSYMYQNTDRKYRDYYMATLSVQLPRRRRTDAAVAEASETLIASRSTLDAHLQQQMAEAKQQYVKASGDSDLLKIYREGLIPQSDAASRATLNAYSTSTAELKQVLTSLLSVLNLKLASAQLIADHELALARLETLTGASLR